MNSSCFSWSSVVTLSCWRWEPNVFWFYICYIKGYLYPKSLPSTTGIGKVLCWNLINDRGNVLSFSSRFLTSSYDVLMPNWISQQLPSWQLQVHVCCLKNKIKAKLRNLQGTGRALENRSGQQSYICVKKLYSTWKTDLWDEAVSTKELLSILHILWEILLWASSFLCSGLMEGL